MEAPAPARLFLALVVIAGLLLAGGAVSLTLARGDLISPLFRHALTIQIIVALVVWSLLALAARRVLVGKSPKLPLNSTAAVIWGGTRIALAVATATVMVCWLAALPLGHVVETTLIRAIVLLIVVTFFTGIVGGAFLNSVLVVRRRRQRIAE